MLNQLWVLDLLHEPGKQKAWTGGIWADRVVLTRARQRAL